MSKEVIKVIEMADKTSKAGDKKYLTLNGKYNVFEAPVIEQIKLNYGKCIEFDVSTSADGKYHNIRELGVITDKLPTTIAPTSNPIANTPVAQAPATVSLPHTRTWGTNGNSVTIAYNKPSDLNLRVDELLGYGLMPAEYFTDKITADQAERESKGLTAIDDIPEVTPEQKEQPKLFN